MADNKNKTNKEDDPFADVKDLSGIGPDGDKTSVESHSEPVGDDPKRALPSVADLNKENFTGKDGEAVHEKRSKDNEEDEDKSVNYDGHAGGVKTIKGR